MLDKCAIQETQFLQYVLYVLNDSRSKKMAIKRIKELLDIKLNKENNND